MLLGVACLHVPAWAEDCPGHPDAIGTSRTIVVDPTEHPRIGTMQYEETLPLHDHEVVLTFDDGPLPPHSKQVLDILASQCVKATFFIIGRMAKAFPEGVRRVRDAGHTIGTHSQNHPLSFDRMAPERFQQEIEEGIASTKAALGNDSNLAPFFRIPGLLRAPQVEAYLASRGLMTWSADFPADDWRPISSDRVFNLALSRLEAKGKGILLLHDIQARTVAALPAILRTLKARGYRIVHVVPAAPGQAKTPTEKQEWRLRPLDAPVASAQWPRVRPFVATTPATAAPRLTNLGVIDGTGALITVTEGLFRGRRPRIPLPPAPIWPRHAIFPVNMQTAALAAPAEDLFRIREMPDDDGVFAPLMRRAAMQRPARSEDLSAAAKKGETFAAPLLPGAWPIPAKGLVRH